MRLRTKRLDAPCRSFSFLYFLLLLSLTLCLIYRTLVPLKLDDELQIVGESPVLKRSNPAQPLQNGKSLLSPPPPLHELTYGSIISKKSCPPNLEYVKDVHGPTPLASEEPRRIPMIVHQTAKSRCIPASFANLVKKWKFPGWSYYFHDDDAMERLFELDFPEFPHLKIVLRSCVTNGTLKADLWRYLVLWLYGGVYADFDSAPNEFTADTISPTDDGFFVVEQYHLLSQYFMAVSPRHPLMFYAIQYSLVNLLDAPDTRQIGAHKYTGPHALHLAFQAFRRDVGEFVDPIGPGSKPVHGGRYKGSNNRHITIRGVAQQQNQFVERTAVSQKERLDAYNDMGMVHFSKYTKANRGKQSGLTCISALRNDAYT